MNKSSYPRQYLYVCEGCQTEIHAVAVSTGSAPLFLECVAPGCGCNAHEEEGPVVSKKTDPTWELYLPEVPNEFQKLLGIKILKLRQRTNAEPDFLDEKLYQLYKK